MSNSATSPSFIMKTYLRQGATELPAADFRAGQGASRMSGGGGWKLRLPSQGLQPFQVASNFMFSAEAVIIIRSQITEWNALLQNMVDGDEHGVGHGHGRPVLSASCRDTASRHSGGCPDRPQPRSTDVPRRGTGSYLMRTDAP